MMKLNSKLQLAFVVLGVSSGYSQTAQPSVVSSAFVKVPELTLEWQNFESKGWAKAGRFADFRVATGELKAPAAAQPSEIRIAHDGTAFFVRFTATDTEVAKAKTMSPPVDAFSKNFPRGDHAEVWIKMMGAIVFAFDANGNRYEAKNYDQKFSSGFSLKSRTTATGWESVLMIPMRSCIDLNKPPQDLGVSFVRHLDHGDGKPERSTSNGEKANTMSTIKIEW